MALQQANGLNHFYISTIDYYISIHVIKLPGDVYIRELD